MPRLLLIDNYDSFTWNLAALLQMEGAAVDVMRNDALPRVAEIESIYDGVVISPGPGLPLDAGQAPERVSALIGSLPMLGVCLGHQLLAELTGGSLIRCREPVHGKVHHRTHLRQGLFTGFVNRTPVMRYHSWAVDESSLARQWTISARTERDDCVMAIEHPSLKLWGVQFHPESILTYGGNQMIRNWLQHIDTENKRNFDTSNPKQPQKAWSIS